MSSNTFENVALSDGQIVKVELEKAVLRVTVRYWREQLLLLEFEDVYGMEAFGPLHGDLDGMTRSSDDPLVEQLCKAFEEPTDGVFCYSFVSADDDRILRVVARSYTVKRSAE